ncbi:MAG: DUF1349 domain-containing protein [Chloroflexi bacterium]|nr:DUF1349 domain-containing protein [Chloroflexota bacterium]
MKAGNLSLPVAIVMILMAVLLSQGVTSPSSVALAESVAPFVEHTITDGDMDAVATYLAASRIIWEENNPVLNSSPTVDAGGPYTGDEGTTIALETATALDPDGDTVTYDVYFEANSSSPDQLKCNDVANLSCNPGMLDTNTHYYWKVVARDSHGATTTGPVWDFWTVQRAGLNEFDSTSMSNFWTAQSGGNDEFDSTSLSNIWTWIDPDNDGAYSLTDHPGWLRLITPYGDNITPLTNVWHQNCDAGRIMQSVTGDFTAETKVVLVNPANSFQFGGILVFLDKNNYVMLNRGYSYGDEVGAGWAEDGIPDKNVLKGFHSSPTWLRMKRVGNMFSFFYSANGTDWQSLGTKIFNNLPDTIQVGLVAGYANNQVYPDFKADFDYFHLSTSATPTNHPPYQPSNPTPPDDSYDQPTSLILSWSGGDPDGDSLTFAWTVDSPLCSFSNATVLNPTITCSDNGTYTVTLTVSDGVNEPVTDDATVTVSNVAPVVDAGPDQTVYEDSVVNLALVTFTDPGVLDTHTATIDWGDGSPLEIGIVSEVGGSGTVTSSHVYPDPGVYTVTVTVTDNDDYVGTDTMVATVIHGFLKFCVFGEASHRHADHSNSHNREGDHHGITVYRQSILDCSAGSNGKVNIKQRTTVAGDVVSLEDKVSLDQEANVQGNVTATGDAELKQQSLVQGNVTTGSDAKLKQEATVQGDVIAAGEVKLAQGATVAGTIQEGASVSQIPPIMAVALSLRAGGPDVEVEESRTLALPPGSYGKLKVRKEGTLNLSSGQYAFREIKVDEKATISLDLANGPVVVDVVEEMDLKHDVRMEVSGIGSAADILWRVAGEHVHLGQGGSYLGTFLAPNADIDLYENAVLEGALYGQRVDIKRRADVIGKPALDVFVTLFLR